MTNIVVPDKTVLITTDVFDTLLLRSIRSETSRIDIAERMFSRSLRDHGHDVSSDLLIRARRSAQKLAFLAMGRSTIPQEVRLADIVARQLAILGLPAGFADMRLRMEVEVEMQSLSANRTLADRLRQERQKGRRIVAVSDTTLSTEQVATLIRHFHGDLVDAVYASADHGCTKHRGEFFDVVAAAEGVAAGDMFHIGDDPRADVAVPATLGIATCHVPRPRALAYVRKLNAAAVMLRRKAARNRPAVRTGPSVSVPMEIADSAHAFGRAVFGPIMAEMSLLIWLYGVEAQRSGQAPLLFCMRGGMGMRLAFDRTVARLALPQDVTTRLLYVSRLIAARSAILQESPSALAEIGYEFRDQPMSMVARALGGRSYTLPDAWSQPFDGPTFLDLLNSPTGDDILDDIMQQDALFARHLDDVCAGAHRVILCDTGLYGSTLRLLSDGFPDKRFEGLQIARVNYKRQSTSHFPRLTGLFVEGHGYNPFDAPTVVLRFWHLIESVFEPDLPSVRHFSKSTDGLVSTNSKHPDGNAEDMFGALMRGALSYIDDLPAVAGGAQAMADAGPAWVRLRKAILRPDANDLRILSVGSRSIDFGRDDKVDLNSATTGLSKLEILTTLKGAFWREGVISRHFPILKHVILPVLEMTQTAKSLFAVRRGSGGSADAVPRTASQEPAPPFHTAKEPLV
ncbi:Haloacid dehalogenase-like hydrolase [Loktanella fryxellensis]|uniref:Haloacid dehalogenase-like hydrolase n=1 Tax=Loktanella fryxellensis TaxID=245187 RepID=A0A1H8GYN3_9RHOB|nr:hypothetical protein [Loktanella fryxellensis]SEN49113.1 Haloacid dehalogenase-like hydrolase [Loktanella fryxellensis]